MKFKVEYIVHPEEGGGYSVEFPWIPNCFTEGETVEEARANAREVAEDIISHHFAEHPDSELFRYEPWDWETAPGKTYQLEVEVLPPATAARPPCRARRNRRSALAPVAP